MPPLCILVGTLVGIYLPMYPSWYTLVGTPLCTHPVHPPGTHPVLALHVRLPV